MEYNIVIGNLERNLPLCRLSDELYIAAFDMFGDNDLIQECADNLILATDFDYDVIVTLEAKAIPLAYEMSLRTKKPWVVARKKIKAYMQNPKVVTVKSITTFDTQMLVLDELQCNVIKGKKILIVDDVISTGASVDKISNLVEQVGGIIVGKACILAEGEAANRTDIVYLEKLPLFNNQGEPINEEA